MSAERLVDLDAHHHSSLGYLIRPELAILAVIGYLVILWWLVLPGSDEVNMYGEPLTQQPGSQDAANE